MLSEGIAQTAATGSRDNTHNTACRLLCTGIPGPVIYTLPAITWDGIQYMYYRQIWNDMSLYLGCSGV